MYDQLTFDERMCVDFLSPIPAIILYLVMAGIIMPLLALVTEQRLEDNPIAILGGIFWPFALPLLFSYLSTHFVVTRLQQRQAKRRKALQRQKEIEAELLRLADKVLEE